MEKLISVTVFKHSELVCVFDIFVNMSACAVHECILGCVCSNQLPKKMLVVSFSMGKGTKQYAMFICVFKTIFRITYLTLRVLFFLYPPPFYFFIY